MTVAARIIPAILLAVLMQGFASRALAATPPPVTATVSVATDDDDIMWVGAQVSEAEETIRTKIFAPENKDGHRRLWQVCEFGFSGSGEYRCGIDVAAGSYAAKRDGIWIARLFVGSERVARTTFSL